MPQQIKFQLNQLRCIVESDAKGGSEPYLWMTYFVVDGRNIGTQTERVTTSTPVFIGIRKEFPDNIIDGQIVNVPPFIANYNAQIDPGPVNFMLAGCVVVLWEEDDTPDKAMFAGLRAYVDAIKQELNKLVDKRIGTLDRSPVSDAEVKAIRDAIELKIKSAIKDNLTLGQKLFDNQDDVLSFAHVAFINSEVQSRNFEFPELIESGAKNRFVLSGTLTVGPVIPDPVDPCENFRKAVKAKRNEIQSFENQKASLQQQLQTASPQEKPFIIKQIQEINGKISRAKEQLKQREVFLKTCETGLSPTNAVGSVNQKAE